MSGAPEPDEQIDRMLVEVSDAIGLDDYGHPSFRDGLEQLIASARSGAQLTPLGEAVLDSTCRAALTNRLRVTDWCRRHPARHTRPIPVSSAQRTSRAVSKC